MIHEIYSLALALAGYHLTVGYANANANENPSYSLVCYLCMVRWAAAVTHHYLILAIGFRIAISAIEIEVDLGSALSITTNFLTTNLGAFHRPIGTKS